MIYTKCKAEFPEEEKTCKIVTWIVPVHRHSIKLVHMKGYWSFEAIHLSVQSVEMDQLEAKADYEGGRDSIILYVNGKRYQIY